MKLQNVTVRDHRARKLVSLPWKMIGPTFGSVRFSHAELGAVVLIARTPDRAGTVCTFKGPAVFDRVHVDIHRAAAEAFRAFRSAAGEVEPDTGGAVVATIPAAAMATLRDVAKNGDGDCRWPFVFVTAGRLLTTNGQTFFAAEVADVGAARTVRLPLAGLATFPGGEVRDVGAGRLAAGQWAATENTEKVIPHFELLLELPPGGWNLAADRAELVAAIKSVRKAADVEAVRLSIAGLKLRIAADDDSYADVAVEGCGDMAFTAKWNAKFLLECLAFTGKGGRVRLAGRDRLLRVEGDAEPGRCAMVAPIVEKARRPVPV